IVGAVQELGSVLGPLYGAAVLAFGSWRDIFWLNLIIGLLLAVVLLKFRATETTTPSREPLAPDRISIAMFYLLWVITALVLYQPEQLISGYWTGLAFLSLFGTSFWFSPLGLASIVLIVLLILRSLWAENALFNVKVWREISRDIDLIGAFLLTT